jgi:hypothetical protein
MSLGTSEIPRIKLCRSGTEHIAPLELFTGLSVFAIKCSAPSGASLNTAKLMPNTTSSQQAR